MKHVKLFKEFLNENEQKIDCSESPFKKFPELCVKKKTGDKMPGDLSSVGELVHFIYLNPGFSERELLNMRLGLPLNTPQKDTWHNGGHAFTNLLAKVLPTKLAKRTNERPARYYAWPDPEMSVEEIKTKFEGTWLNESVSARNTDFMMKFIDLVKETKFPTMTFEDWWSVSGRDYDDSRIWCNNLERVERNKPAHSRYKGEIYYLEFKIKTSQTSHGYSLIIIDTRNWKVDIQKDYTHRFLPPDDKERFSELFDKLLKKELPNEYHGKQYGI